MKKLFSVLFVSLFILGSCTKEGECNNGCSDNEVIGYWTEGDVGVFIGQDFTGTFYINNASENGKFTCTGNHLNFSGELVSGHSFVGVYNVIQGNTMQLNVSDGWSTAIGNYTLTKQ